MSQLETDTNKMVLVVEDNSINQRVTLLQLEDLGLTACAVSNGLEALNAVSQAKYILILMDCQMPEMDGLQATREIRRLEKTTGEHVTIIALTAHAMTSDRAECLAAGMDDYITKPVKLKKLAEVLQRWVKQPLNFDFKSSRSDSKNEALVKPVELDVLFSVFGKDLIADLLVDFIAEADEQMIALRKAVIEKDLPTIKFLIHDLKGTSATIYATNLTEQSFAMEQYAHSETQIDWKKIDSHLQPVESAWKAVRDYLAKNGYNGPPLDTRTSELPIRD
jgi:two-component system sensor histidine kinase/response regulator